MAPAKEGRAVVNMHQLQQQMQRIAQRARRVVVYRGVFATVVTCCAALLVTSCVDWLFQIQTSGIRLLLLFGFAAATGFGVWYYLRPALHYRWSDVSIARRVERRYPHLGDRLSSSIEFLSQDEHDRAAGSAELRRAVITQLDSEGHDFQPRDLVRVEPARRAGMWSGGLLLTLCLLVSVGPLGLAARHVLMPWTRADWPRANHLVFENAVDCAAFHSAVEFTVADQNGEIPAVVELLVWHDGDSRSRIDRNNMMYRGGKMVYRLENLTRPLRYRAVGGDDHTMAWQTLQVVRPAEFESLSLRVIPPAYTGWPAHQVMHNFLALEGSRVEVNSVVNKPLAKAQRFTTDSAGQKHLFPLPLGADRRSIKLSAVDAAAWEITASGKYGWLLTDQEGLTSGDGQAWHIQALPDRPPAINEKDTGFDDIVTAAAEIPVQLTASDDLMLHFVQLRFSRSDRSPDDQSTVDLYRGADTAGNRPRPNDLVGAPRDVHRVTATWQLADIADLQPGTVLSYQVVAGDYRPQENATQTRRLTVVSRDELRDHLATRQGLLLQRLTQILLLQRDAKTLAADLHGNLQTSAHSTQPDIDRMQSTELKQRDVQARLATDQKSVLVQTARMLDDLKRNQLEESDVHQNALLIHAILRDLNRDQLSPAQSLLIAANKRLRSAGPGTLPPNTVHELATTLDHQEHIIVKLEELISELTRWNEQLQFAQDIRGLLQEQSDLRKQTTGLRNQRLQSNRPDKATEVQAQSLARQQYELARRYQRVLRRMQQASQNESPSSQLIRSAMDVNRQHAIDSKMRDSSQRIQNQQLGLAAEQQKLAMEGLEQLEAALSDRQTASLREQVQGLRDAGQELKRLRDRHRILRRQSQQQTVEAQNSRQLEKLEKLLQQREQLQDELDRLARKLERFDAERPAELVNGSSQQVGQAGQSQRAGESQKSIQSDLDAEKQLAEAQKQLAQQRNQREQDLLREQMQQLAAALKGLADRQEQFIGETIRLEQLRVENDRVKLGQPWTDAQVASVDLLAGKQQTLLVETRQLDALVERAGGFQLGLKRMRQYMQAASGELRERRLGNETVTSEHLALLQIHQMIAALEPDPSPPGDNDQPPPGRGQQNGESGAGPQNQLSELKLLQLMQEEIVRRTAELDQKNLTQGRLSQLHSEELGNLARQQGELADIIQAWLRRQQKAPRDTASPPENNDPGESLEEQLEKSLDDALLDSIE